jgi:hypothetical protein
MKSGIIRPNDRSRSKLKDAIARWVSFLALAALLAMATLPITPGQRDVAAENTVHWSKTWHG